MTGVPEALSSGSSRRRILLGQLNANGDCLYATTVARQIKNDFPDCHLTWAIGSMCRKIINNNPHVDAVWEIPLRSTTEAAEVWFKFEHDAKERLKAGEFDQVFLTQIFPGNLDRFDGSIRSTLFRSYPGKITVPVSPVIHLSESEVQNVRIFAEQHRLQERSHVILFESSSKSGQSFMTAEAALDLANKIASEIPGSAILLSSDGRVPFASDQVIDASVLSIRENAELTRYCSLLIGCSSGITWICTSDWAKPLPTIQLIEPNATWLNSLTLDHAKWGLPTDQIIEMTNCSNQKIFDCVRTVLVAGFITAKSEFHVVICQPLGPFVNVAGMLFDQGRTWRALLFLIKNVIRRPQLLVGRTGGRIAALIAKYGWHLAWNCVATCGGRGAKHFLRRRFPPSAT